MSDSPPVIEGSASEPPAVEGRPASRRRFSACLLAAALGLCGALTALVGLAAGVMGTDGCSSTPPGWISLWLVVVWPAAVMVTALLPPALIARGTPLWKTGLAFLAACLTSIGIWMLWIPILDLFC